MRRLLDLLENALDDAEGDIALVDEWAQRLGVREWYRWAVLDELPPAQAMLSA